MKSKIIIIAALISLFTTLSTYITHANVGPVDTYQGLVILEIEDLTDDAYLEIQKKLSGQMNYNLEYGCVENGIIVVKFLDSKFSGEADNAKMIENQIRSSIDRQAVKRIFVKVRAYNNASKC